MTARIVLVNGVSSVGKGSVAKALQRVAQRPMLHVQMDAFLEMMPSGSFGAPEGYTFETRTEGGKSTTSGGNAGRAAHGQRPNNASQMWVNTRALSRPPESRMNAAARAMCSASAASPARRRAA